MKESWIDPVKALGFQAVAAELGISASRGRSYGPCPACRAERRGSGDQRGPMTIVDSSGWHCWACKATGDTIDLVAYHVEGARLPDLTTEAFARVKSFCIDRGWADRGAPKETTAQIADRLMEGGGGRRKRRGGSIVTSSDPEPESDSDADEGEESIEDSNPGTGGPFGWDPFLAKRAVADLWADTDDARAAREYLTSPGSAGGRGLSEEAIRHWSIGLFRPVSMQGTRLGLWITIPLHDQVGDVVNVRFRTVPGECTCEGWADCPACKGTGIIKKMFRVCPNRPLPLYGVQSLTRDTDTNVLIVEGELDVVALWDMGRRENCVSGTAGAGTFASKDEWLDAVEPFTEVLLGFDNDDAGLKGALDLSEKIGREKCSRVRWPRKDAGECLAGTVDKEPPDRAVVLSAIQHPVAISGVEVRSLGSYRDVIKAMIRNPEKLRGLPTGSAKMDRCLGGFRGGLMVISGESGEGKTTLATFLCLRQAQMGVPGLITSFEQRPEGTVQKCLRAQVAADFAGKSDAEIDEAMDRLDELPLKVVHHRGHMAPAVVFETIKREKRRRGIKIVLIDHLGFCLDPDADDERREIEGFVRALSLFGEHEEILIMLIVHPSNQAAVQQRRVGMGDLKGASAIRQDAHDILIVQRGKTTQKKPAPFCIIWFDKIRSEYGIPGSHCELAFDPVACSYGDSWEDTPAGRRGSKFVVDPTDRPGGTQSGARGRRGRRSAQEPGISDRTGSENTEKTEEP